MVAFSRLVTAGLLFVAPAGLVGCGAESKPTGDGGDDASGGTGASGGSTATGGAATGGSSGTGGSGVTGGSGGSGGSMGPLSCLEGVAGIWAAVGFPAYLDIDSACRVNLFCDIPNDYHTTGYVDANLLVLIDVAMKIITVEGDVLTVIDAGSDGTDLPFARQTSADAIPQECRL